MKKSIFYVFAFLVIGCVGHACRAEYKGDYDPYNGSSFDPFAKPLSDIKDQAPWLNLGGDFRFRMDYDEMRKLDKNAVGHDRLNTRYRIRVKGKIKAAEGLDVNFRLMTEPRYYHRPDSMEEPFVYNEGLFDQLNISWREVFGLPMTVTAGRQEIKLGSQWLLIDGTPLDGGRTNYFDAVRVRYDFKEQNTTADLIWIENYADSSKYIEPFNDQDCDWIEQDEQGAVVYVSNRPSEDTRIDGYFMYKHDHDRNRSSGDEGETYTPGVMYEKHLDEHWSYCLEAAPQFGHKNGHSLDAFATNNQLTYEFKDPGKNKAYVGYEYLSGDDDPDRYFDKVWGRVDTWSVLYQGTIDSLDGRAYDNSNLHRLHFGWIGEPMAKTEIRAGYHLLFADENSSAGGTKGLSESGGFRGQLFRAQLEYYVNEHLCHRFEGEVFLPGNFYNDDRNDVAVFFRYGIAYSW